MKRVIRLTEQDLASIVKKVLGNIQSDFFSDDKNDEKKDTTSSSTSSVAPKSFEDSVNKVIDKFEGGYYHPDMVKDGRTNVSLGKSGETMMGMDRKHGVGFTKTAAGKKFWDLIDGENARKNWKYNYMGGPLESQLRSLVAEQIKPEFEKLCNTYLNSEARKIVKNSPDLTFHFIYATWNGSGWFQKFANKINDAVDKGIKDPQELTQIAMDSRKQSGNSLIAKSGNIMSKVLNVA